MSTIITKNLDILDKILKILIILKNKYSRSRKINNNNNNPKTVLIFLP